MSLTGSGTYTQRPGFLLIWRMVKVDYILPASSLVSKKENYDHLVTS